MGDPPEQVNPDAVRHLDLRPLLADGDKPFDLIMDTIADLEEGEALCLLAPFQPTPLVRVLAREGWQACSERDADGGWIIWFFRS